MSGRAFLLSVALVLSAVAADATAGTFQISPTRLDLAARGNSAIFTLTNTGALPVRLQAKGFAWDQSLTGEQVLSATQDLVVFPTLFTLASGETRKVKVGITVAPEVRERSYRLIVEELPAPASAAGTGLRVLTRMSMPIFQAPRRQVVAGVVSQVALRGELLAVEVQNRGTVNVMLQAARATCKDGRGDVVWQGEAAGWYLLAGGARAFELAVPAEKAARISSVEIEAVTDQGSWKRRAEIERK
jgi:fimbrial chaperone protein